MRKSLIISGAAIVAALAALGGSAFTGTGVDNQAGATQFVGGTVSQTVTGATLSSIDYTFTDTTNTAVQSIALTFANTADGRTVAVTPAGNASGGTFTCSNVSTNASSCTYTVGTDTLTGYKGLTSLDVTVS